MQIVRSVARMQRLGLAWKRNGFAVGFVPTMGFLHAGHVSLIDRARAIVGPGGKVVVSIYVNPTQFGPHEDLAKYPRDPPRDRGLCQQAGVDVLFMPADRDMYPRSKGQRYSTYVVEEHLSRVMEGASRPSHFRGVTTIVAKLFNIVLPTAAVFGAKDFQQASVVRQMIRDLNFPVRLVVAPTVREHDGLALSSRNSYLSAEERRQAGVLWQAIQTARETVRAASRPVPASRLRERLERLIHQRPDARVDYIQFFHPDSLEPEPRVHRGTRMALAVFVGKTRLIDNAQL